MPGSLHFLGAPLPASLPSSALLLPREAAALAHRGPGRWEARGRVGAAPGLQRPAALQLAWTLPSPLWVLLALRPLW